MHTVNCTHFANEDGQRHRYLNKRFCWIIFVKWHSLFECT